MTAPACSTPAEPTLGAASQSATAVRLALHGAPLDAWLSQLLAGVDAATAAELRSFCESTRASFLDLLDHIEDDEDQQLMVAAHYIERKARWIQLNTAIQYRRLATGRSDSRLVYEASIASVLLGAIEPLIDPASLARINELLERPIL